jgi:septal ring factor EnvC (AmiA/AmiB activator)
MFGFKKKGQAKSVEEFLKSQDAVSLSAADSPAAGESRKPGMKGRYLAPAVATAVLLALLVAAFIKIGSLKSDVAQLRLQTKSQSTDNLKARISGLSAKVDQSDRQAAALRADIGRLEKELAAIKLMNLRRQKTEAAAKKPAGGKKKPVKRKV